MKDISRQQASFSNFASTTSYETILSRYKTKKDLLLQTAAKQSCSTARGSEENSYLSFMEKQLERTSKAFQEAAQQREALTDLGQRMELLELAQADQARKWSLFVGDIGVGRQAMQEQEREMLRKSIEGLIYRVQALEEGTTAGVSHQE